MSECFNDLFFINGNIQSSVLFDDNFFNEGISFYEVLRIIHGKYLFLEEHLERLKTSIEIYHIKYKPDIEVIIKYLLKYKTNINISEGNIKIVSPDQRDVKVRMFVQSLSTTSYC